MVSSEYERDFEQQGALKRPGRIDLRLLQNIDNAVDGYPGLQKCFRNLLYAGYMEEDIDLVEHGIKGTSVDINNAELQQLSNIGSSVITTSIWSQIANITSATISSAQWGYLGELDQTVKIGSSPSYLKMTLTQTTGTPPLTVSSSSKVINLNVDQCDGQHLGTVNSPTFAGLTMTGAIAMGNNKITNVLNPTEDQEVATKIYVDNYLPIGTILMYSGVGWVDNSTILGWYKCDGNNGTVNLVNKFVRGGASSGATGGSDDAVVVSHTHDVNSVSVTGSGVKYLAVPECSISLVRSDVIRETGVSGVGKNIPEYYTLIFIQRIS